MSFLIVFFNIRLPDPYSVLNVLHQFVFQLKQRITKNIAVHPIFDSNREIFFSHRYIAIMRPLKHHMSRKRTVFALLMIWATSSVLAIPCLLYSTTKSRRYGLIHLNIHDKNVIYEYDNTQILDHYDKMVFVLWENPVV